MEGQKIWISVIVPVYNVELYLRECIESIINQSFVDFELILVNDGSTDNSGEICEQYAREDSRIRVIHKDNGGLSSARNIGLDFCRGEYVAFVDSDDVIHRDYLKEMSKLVQTHTADLVACHFVKGESCSWEETEENLDIRCGREIIERMNDNDVVVTVAWNKLYHQKFFKDMGFRYPEGKIHEDMFLTPQILLKTSKMIITNKKLYFYRQRPNSIMTGKFSLKQLDILDAVEFRIDLLRRNGYERLLREEYEGYIRKIRRLFLKMQEQLNDDYNSEKNRIYGMAKEIFCRSEKFKQLSLKYKVKLLVFLLLKK